MVTNWNFTELKISLEIVKTIFSSLAEEYRNIELQYQAYIHFSDGTSRIKIIQWIFHAFYLLRV